VRDWRLSQIAKLSNVELFRESRLEAQEIADLGYGHVVVATGAYWRRDGHGNAVHKPIAGLDQSNVFTPDDVMAGARISGPVMIYDDDQYYMGGVLAEKLLAEGHHVILATPGTEISSWTAMTDEQFRVQKSLLSKGLDFVPAHVLSRWLGQGAELACRYTGRRREIECANLLLVTARRPNDALYWDLLANEARLRSAGLKTVARIGDCEAPGALVHATYSGHKFARQFGEEIDPDTFPYRRELVFVK
jgi:dimethylamine/trimethylamine dehydrogenase